MSTFSIGTKVKVIRVPGKQSSACPVGEWQVLSNVPNSGYKYMVSTNIGNYWAFEYEVNSLVQTRKHIQEKIGEHNKEIADLNTRLEWMDEVGENNFDEEEYKIYQGLTVIESSNDKKAKVKALKALFNS